MKKLVSNAGHVPSFLPSWKTSNSADPQFTEYISGLEIPVDKAQRPNLLLHRLGEEKFGQGEDFDTY